MKQGELAKYCAQAMAAEPERVFLDREIADLLGEEWDSGEYRFAWLRTKDILEKQYDYYAFRVSCYDRARGVEAKGYRAATDLEKLDVVRRKNWERSKNLLDRTYAMLTTVDERAMDGDARARLDSCLVKTGFMKMANSAVMQDKVDRTKLEMHVRDPKPITYMLTTKEGDGDV